MSTPNRQSRSRRGRVVVVGSQEFGEIPGTVVHAANLFDAVGEVTVAGDAEPVGGDQRISFRGNELKVFLSTDFSEDRWIVPIASPMIDFA